MPAALFITSAVAAPAKPEADNDDGRAIPVGVHARLAVQGWAT
jgi:hypothetical protein